MKKLYVIIFALICWLSLLYVSEAQQRPVDTRQRAVDAPQDFISIPQLPSQRTYPLDRWGREITPGHRNYQLKRYAKEKSFLYYSEPGYYEPEASYKYRLKRYKYPSRLKRSFYPVYRYYGSPY